MKACSYCGRENSDDAPLCSACGTEFSILHLEEKQPKPSPNTPTIDLSQLDFGFEVNEGFSRPNWNAIGAFVENKVPKEDWPAAWSCIAEKWLEQMAKDLGGSCRVHRSENFLCLSDLDEERTRTLLLHAESVLGIIGGTLQEAAWTGDYGKHVLLFFSDPDDYFAYISFYYPEGTHVLSSGVFLASGYAHVALPYLDPSSAEHVLVHELVHNLLCHLPIPAWLNEGLAVIIEGRVFRRPFVIDRELVDRHARHWNDKNIQAFWAGEAFHVAGDESELSYSLGGILVTLLSENADFKAFIMNADWRDAGQDAAVAILDRDLGEVAAGFLGAGNWRPQRRAISEYFNRKPVAAPWRVVGQVNR